MDWLQSLTSISTLVMDLFRMYPGVKGKNLSGHRTYGDVDTRKLKEHKPTQRVRARDAHVFMNINTRKRRLLFKSTRVHCAQMLNRALNASNVTMWRKNVVRCSELVGIMTVSRISRASVVQVVAAAIWWILPFGESCIVGPHGFTMHGYVKQFCGL
jgi:hypothetical protein